LIPEVFCSGMFLLYDIITDSTNKTQKFIHEFEKMVEI